MSTNFSATLSMIVKDTDVLVLGYFRSPLEVGYYKLALSIVNWVVMPVAPLVQSIYPEIAREAARHQWHNFRSLLRKGSLIAMTYLIPVYLFFAICSSWLIGIFYGKEFVPAAVAANILLLGIVISYILFWSRPALLALGRPDYPLKINFYITAIKIIGMFIFFPLFGYIGSAALMSTLYAFGSIASTAKIYALTQMPVEDLG